MENQQETGGPQVEGWYLVGMVPVDVEEAEMLWSKWVEQ
jgi:hypothetical protein